MENSTYCVKITGPDFSFEQNLTEKEARRLTTIVVQQGFGIEGWSNLASNPNTSPKTHTQTTTQTNQPQAKLSISEFISQSQATRTPDKLTAMAIYLHDFQGIDQIQRKIFTQQFKLIGQTAPKNLSRDLSWALRLGWLERLPHNSRLYRATTTGRQLVEQKFPQTSLTKTTLAAAGGR